ncbi:hypothetical protein DMN91_011509 [Ooceraea biroi]|uniref:Uncharacterized protein n=1 Tax=Ooceraea biroi TaxID=2015173 RepID=A0A3L8D6T2_OOCBI|nr:hypothetical protein DMN91_011509 [Ooceraea biroi]
MIKPYGQKRYLRDHAIPMLHIPNTAADGASTSSTEIGTVAVVESSENAGGNSNFPTTCGTEHQITITTVPAVDVANLRRKIRRQKKLLYKRKNIINLHRQQKKKKKKTHRSDTWEEATTDLPQTQKLVLDMMYRNFHHASQESKDSNTAVVPRMLLDALLYNIYKGNRGNIHATQEIRMNQVTNVETYNEVSAFICVTFSKHVSSLCILSCIK